MKAPVKISKFLGALLLTGASAPLAWAGSGINYPSYTPDLLPANPQTGLCYARVKIPAQYSTDSEEVLIEEGYQKLDVSQPVLAPRTEQVMVKEASVRYQVRQPSYKTVSEKIMTRPSYDKLSVSAPTFSTVTETIKVSQPRLVWKRGNPGKLIAKGYKIHSTANAGVGGHGYSSTSQYGQMNAGGTKCGDACEIWCLVEEPGESVSYNKKVMTSPGRVQRQTVPAKYQTIMKQVVADPGGVTEVPIPAEYRSVTVEDLVSYGGENSVNVPAKYGKIAKKVLVSPERYEWRQVVCAPGTGSIRSSQSYAKPVTPAVVTPSYSAPTYSSSSSSYGSGVTQSGSTVSIGPNSNYTAPAARKCKGTTCVDTGVHRAYEHGRTSHTSGKTGSGHTYSGMGKSESSKTFSSGSTLDSKNYPAITSDNLKPRIYGDGAKRTKWRHK